MRQVYLDNAATSFPKAPGVAESVSNYLLNVGCNVNRGVYEASFEAENILYETRELISDFFNFNKPENVVFTKSVTESLNVLLKGLLANGDHVIVSSMEHNAVMRPLNSLEKVGVKYSRVTCSLEGRLDADDIKRFIKPNTKAVVMSHASNVCGTVLPLKNVGKICREHNLFFIIDSAQTAGSLNVDFVDLNADAIAFTGHKGFLGPQGIGGFIINDRLASKTRPLIEGGTGSLSDHETQPEYMPDKFEAGTPNIPGIFGLNAALKYLVKAGVDAIFEHEFNLTDIFIKGVKNMNGVKVVGIQGTNNRMSVVSLDFLNFDNAEVSYVLAKDYGIMTRCGLHCAPSAHKTLGTFPKGTVRFSFGHFNTLEEVNYTIDCIYKYLKN
jgi:cysteine desulfurase family protein